MLIIANCIGKFTIFGKLRQQIMKANELRIGNWVQYHLLDESQDEWMDCLVDVSDIADPEDLKPIPLTEEWLTKFRFVSLDAEQDYYEWGLDDGGNGEVFHIEQNGYYALDQPYEFRYDIGFGEKSIIIKYVHQLQNLYFALTGEEL